MAKFYLGNLESADKGMWEALRVLPDEYHVFIEFQIPDPQRQRKNRHGGKQRAPAQCAQRVTQINQKLAHASHTHNCRKGSVQE